MHFLELFNLRIELLTSYVSGWLAGSLGCTDSLARGEGPDSSKWLSADLFLVFTTWHQHRCHFSSVLVVIKIRLHDLALI